jgi:competence protein ComEC
VACAALYALLARMPVAALSSSLEAGHPLRAGGVSHTRCEAGQQWQWDGAHFAVLHPQTAHYQRAEPKPNTMSCVLRVIDAAGRSLLLTGDLEAEQEQRLLLADAQALRSGVLVVPHHGSQTSSTGAFLDAVQPRLALIQAGYRNRYGHPAPSVLQRYADRGIAVLRSDGRGAWTWPAGTDEEAAYCEGDASARYWHFRAAVAGPSTR